MIRIIIPVPFLRYIRANAMAVFPFILVKDVLLKKDRVLINHELIHFKQQLELLIIPFYIWYIFNYLFNLIKYRNHNTAYREIIFEREAYINDKNLEFLQKRKSYNFLKYR